MSTYLQLCQQTHRLIRAGNNTPGSLPSTVAGQTDPLLLDIIYFVNEAWNQIQQDHPSWIWMNQTATTFALPVNSASQYNQKLSYATIQSAYPTWECLRTMMSAQYRYALLFDPGWASLGQTSPTYMPIYFMPWMEFHGFFDRLPRSSAQPIRFTEDPQFNVWFDPPPLGAPSDPTGATPYQCVIDYRQLPQALVNDTDTPQMPPAFHNLIVYWAAMLYCQTRSNTSDLMASCQSNMQRIMFKLRAKMIPEVVIDDRYA